MLFDHVLDYNYNYLLRDNGGTPFFLEVNNYFRTTKLKSFYISITKQRSLDYLVSVYVERGAVRLNGYLDMKYGDNRRFTIQYDNVNKIFELIKDIDDALTYIYGEPKKRKGG